MEVLPSPPWLVEYTFPLVVIPGVSRKVLDTVGNSLGPSVVYKKMIICPPADVGIMLATVEDRGLEPASVTRHPASSGCFVS